MSHGQIKCLGTPLHLKNKYGDGYRINVTARPDAIDDAKAHINELLPGNYFIPFYGYGLRSLLIYSQAPI